MNQADASDGVDEPACRPTQDSDTPITPVPPAVPDQAWPTESLWPVTRSRRFIPARYEYDPQQIDTWFRAHLQALPVPVAIVRGESPRDLLQRLNRANHLPASSLERGLGLQTHATRDDVHRIALLAGCPPELLERVLLNRGAVRHYRQRYACSRCLARRSVPHPVSIEVLPQVVTCRRHRRWLSPRSGTEHEYDLRAVPEVLLAQQAHRRLARSLPAENLVHNAQLVFDEATDIVEAWSRARSYIEHRDRRLSYYIDVPRTIIDSRHPLVVMANYPETIALARLLADPGWGTVIDPDTPGGRQRIIVDVRQRLRLPYEPLGGFRDPLLQRLRERRDLRGVLEQLSLMWAASKRDSNGQ